jgi:hypothetical protein
VDLHLYSPAEGGGMLVTIATYAAAFVGAFLAEILIGLVLTPVNMVLGVVTVAPLSAVLLKVGRPLEEVEVYTGMITRGFVLVTGAVQGVLAIVVCLAIFQHFGRVP